MAGERIQLGVKARETAGSAESRRLRAAGMVPGVLYGAGKKAHPFTVEERELRRVLTGDHGLHAILDVVFDGQKTAHHAVLKEYQLDPVRPRLLHIDLHEVRLDQTIQAQVAVEPFGESTGVKEGGVLHHNMRDVHVECLPAALPDHIEVDASALTIGSGIHMKELGEREGVRFLDDPDQMVVSVAAPMSDAKLEALLTSGAGAAGEPEVLAKGKESAVGAEGAPGAEPAKAGAASPAGEAKAGEKKDAAAAPKAEKKEAEKKK